MCCLHRFFLCVFLPLFGSTALHGIIYNTDNKSITSLKRSIQSGCVLPPYPKNGNWSVFNLPETQWIPNMVIPSGKFIQIFCNSNYTLENGPNTMTCINGTWTNENLHCWKKCPQLQNTPHLHIVCYDKNNEKIDCSKTSEGAQAEFRCNKFYEIKNAKKQTRIKCLNGTWEGNVPQCVLACGKTKFIDTSLVINGTDAKKGAYPWQVALYDKQSKELICGGSLLSQRVVLTAAHCVTIDGYNYSKLSLVVGNYYSQYNHSNDTSAQFASVQEIFRPEHYRGREQNYINDIAIIVTKETFSFTEDVQPICIDWNSEHLDEAVKDRTDGFVSGWGFTEEDGKPATVLQELKVLPHKYTSCLNYFVRGFRKYLTRDKICAGHLNKSMAVCKGDSGGGLIFKANDRFYVSAIVSVASASSRALTDSCDSQQYSLYTNVSYHRKFIAEKLGFAKRLDSVRSEYCLLPEYPQDGYWSVLDYDYLPTNSVETGTRLEVACEKEYTLRGSKFLVCTNGLWNSTIGTCLKICPPVHSTKSTKVVCKHPDHSTSFEKCVDAIDGTVAQFDCAPFYEDFSLSTNPVRVCVDGKWDFFPPECLPVCGKLDKAMTKKKAFTWHAAIYTSVGQRLVCSGSLINERVTVTAAYCVTDNGHTRSVDDLIVTVGGRYRSFNDPRDSEHIQISEVSSIFRSESSKSYLKEKMYHEDIAVIVTKKTFELTKRVSPVCLDRFMAIDITSNNTHLYASGWGYNIEEAEHPDLRRTVEIPKNITKCDQLFESEHNISLSEDKICTGYTNSTMICYGDIGAGLVIEHEGRCYLGGVLALGPDSPTLEGACDRQKFGVYTRIYSHLERFILMKEVQFRPSLL